MKIQKMHKSSVHKKLPEALNSIQKVSLNRIITGKVIVAKSGMEKTKSKSTEELPVYSYLVHHEKHGDFLIDAGLDESFMSKPYGSQKGLAKKWIDIKAYQREGESIKNYLQSSDIKINNVFLSHLHFDHIAGLMDIDSIKSCIIGKGEKYNQHKPFHYGTQLKHIDTLHELDFENCQELAPLGRAVDFFDDGSFIIIETPGHTQGHISFLLNTPEGSAFICGDAYGYDRESLIKNGPGSYSDDKELAEQTLDRIVEFSRIYPQVKIMTGHGK